MPVFMRDFTVMFVGFSVAFFPIVILAGAKLQPRQQLLDVGAATFVPRLEIIDDGVARVMGDPLFFQRPPVSFFAFTFASINSAMTSLRSFSFSSSAL